VRIAFFRHVNTQNAATCGVNHLPATFVFLDAFIKITLLYTPLHRVPGVKSLCETFTISKETYFVANGQS
jgi:hypothetical protein